MSSTDYSSNCSQMVSEFMYEGQVHKYMNSGAVWFGATHCHTTCQACHRLLAQRLVACFSCGKPHFLISWAYMSYTHFLAKHCHTCGQQIVGHTLFAMPHLWQIELWQCQATTKQTLRFLTWDKLREKRRCMIDLSVVLQQHSCQDCFVR